MPISHSTDVHAKALAINLDPAPYGSFAEIGAGQEVARWFLTVGAASGTVAQTISAYDKTFSDDTYGAGSRYVSRPRLLAMIDHEYQLLVDRLGPARGSNTQFFAFADTASARNFHGDNQQHAWLGVRFQHAPQSESSLVILHVDFKDSTALLQQQALGLLGVNLLYAALYARSGPDEFLRTLWEELNLDRMEVNVVDVSGPAFEGADHRQWCLRLIRNGLGHAVAFGDNGRPAEPSELFHKRPLVIDRGQFNTVEPYYDMMLTRGDQMLRSEGVPLSHDPLRLLEMTLNHSKGGDTPDDPECLSRIDQLGRLGRVLVTDFAETYQLVEYVRRYTPEPIRLALGVSLLALTLEERFYEELPGRLLEGLGRLLDTGVRIYAYPMPKDQVLAALGENAAHFTIDEGDDGMVTVDELIPKPPVDHLYRYLREANWIVPISRA